MLVGAASGCAAHARRSRLVLFSAAAPGRTAERDAQRQCDRCTTLRHSAEPMAVACLERRPTMAVYLCGRRCLCLCRGRASVHRHALPGLSRASRQRPRDLRRVIRDRMRQHRPRHSVQLQPHWPAVRLAGFSARGCQPGSPKARMKLGAERAAHVGARTHTPMHRALGKAHQ